MELAIFGPRGRAGSAIVSRCLEAGYSVKTLTREPSRLAYDHPALQVIRGDVHDQAAVEQVVDGVEAVISALGGTRASNPAVLEYGTTNLLGAMQRPHVRRLIVIQGFHLPVPGDPRTLGRGLVRVLLWLINRRLLADSYRMLACLQLSDLDWTPIRMPPLRVSPRTDGYRVGQFGLGPWSHVTTGQVADFTLRCLTDSAFSHRAPMLAARHMMQFEISP
jgi:putative NAD(P)-binding protein